MKTFSSEDPPEDPIWMGIDQSLTGFAVCLLDDAGRYNIRVAQPKTRGVERLAELDEFLEDILTQTAYVQDVAMEGTVVHSTSASVLGELAGVVKMRLHRFGYSPLIVPPLTLKKFVVGNARNAAKSHMLLATYKRYGVELSDDNAADAYGLARIVRGSTITKVEADVVLKLADPKYRE